MKLFISYRRSDTGDVTGRLYDHLERRVGAQSIFKDTASIAVGARFDDRIRRSLEETEATLVVMGQSWLSARDEHQRRRIDDPDDWVRKEIEMALGLDRPVVPILVDDTQMPAPEAFPATLAPLARLQAIRLRPDPDFRNDVARLCDALAIPNEAPELRGAGRVDRARRSPTMQRPLLVFTTRSNDVEIEFQYTLLFGSAAAAAPSGRRVVRRQALTDTLNGLKQANLSREALERVGEELADLLLPADFQKLLQLEEDTYLLVFHDNAAAAVPWEYVRFGESFAALTGGLSRRLISPVAYIHSPRNDGSPRRPQILVITDPGRNLPGAQEEGRRLAALFAESIPDCQLTLLEGLVATRETVIEMLASQSFDLVHYAGQSFFHEGEPETSGLVLANNAILTAADLVTAARTPPRVVFLASCEAARIAATSSGDRMALAEGFLRCGVSDIVAPTWPVQDLETANFSVNFYSALFRGATVGTALREARRELWRLDHPDALNWVHFGLPENAPLVGVHAGSTGEAARVVELPGAAS